MSRRAHAASIVATAVLVATGLATSSQMGARNSSEQANLTVVYVGADDCTPCRIWRREHWPRFRASPEFAGLVYKEVTSPTLFDLLNDDHWPEELREYRSTLGPASGVPLWLVVSNDEIVLTARGLRQWEDAALPRIRLLTR